MNLNPIVRDDLRSIHAAVGNRPAWDGGILLVTGCAGFLGFYLIQYFLHYAEQLGIRKVIGLDNFLFGKPSWLLQLTETYPNLLSLRAFDVSRDRIEEVDGARDVRYVIHGASIASPTFYRRYPLATIDANIWGLRRLLDFYHDSKQLRGFLFFSSSEVYGEPDPRFIPTPEEYRGNVACLGPRACYDESKRFGETLSYVFAQTYDMPVIIARPFNNYGPGMRPDDRRLPADLAEAVVSGRDITLFSDGSPTRTYCYVSDAVVGYLLCLLHGKYNYFNIGADMPELSVRELAELYRVAGAEARGYAGKVHYETSRDPEYLAHNPNRRCPDIRKARRELGYDPQIDVEHGVRRHLQFLGSAQTSI